MPSLLCVGGGFSTAECLEDMIWKFWEVEEMPRISELSQVEAETPENRFDEEVPYDDKLVSLLPNEAKVRKMTEQKEERLEGKPELENAIKKILSQQVEQGIIEKVPEDEVAERQRHMVPWYCILRPGHPTSQGQKELLLHEFLVKGDCLPQPSFVQLMNELRRTAMNVVTVEIHSQVFDIDRFSDLDRLLNTIDVFRPVHRKTGERTPNVEEQKEALNWLIGALAHWSIGSLEHWLIGALAH